MFSCCTRAVFFASRRNRPATSSSISTPSSPRISFTATGPLHRQIGRAVHHAHAAVPDLRIEPVTATEQPWEGVLAIAHPTSQQATTSGEVVTFCALDPLIHKRYLDYRERHVYFAKMERLLGAKEFEELDKEQRALAAKGEGARDDEEEARFEELASILLLD